MPGLRQDQLYPVVDRRTGGVRHERLAGEAWLDVDAMVTGPNCDDIRRPWELVK
jgi:hypothetical protein